MQDADGFLARDDTQYFFALLDGNGTYSLVVVVVVVLVLIVVSITLRKAENREEWRKLVVKSTVVPQRSARLRDR